MDTSPEARFEQIHAETADRIMAYCLRHAGPQAAEDAAAETFAVAWRKRDQIPDDHLPWLYVVARNTILAQSRKNQRQHQTAERIVPLTDLASQSPELGVERRDEILRALDSLSPDDREAMLLIAWDGLDLRQAARILDTTPGALKVRLHRARTKLRSSKENAHA